MDLEFDPDKDLIVSRDDGRIVAKCLGLRREGGAYVFSLLFKEKAYGFETAARSNENIFETLADGLTVVKLAKVGAQILRPDFQGWLPFEGFDNREEQSEVIELMKSALLTWAKWMKRREPRIQQIEIQLSPSLETSILKGEMIK